MSRFVLFCFVLSLGLLNNEVKCGTLDKISKSNESLLSRAQREGPSHWARLNLQFPSGNKLLVNTTTRIDRTGDTTVKRQSKFLPKFSILAGLDIGGGLSSSRAAANLTHPAKISQASTLPGIFNPYFAASYDPYPPSSAVQQSILSLYRLVERLSLQLDNLNKQPNNSAMLVNALFTSGNISTDIVDDRKRRTDKFKIKKSNPKRKKQEKVKEETEEDTDVDEEKRTQKIETFHKVKSGSKNGVRKNPDSKQATETGMEMNATDSTSMNSTSTNTTTEQGNTTYPQNPGYYYSGNPQYIDNVGFTYDRPQESYGPPSDSYGHPSSNYGPPSTNYDAPSYSFGPPSQSYGSPSYSYGPPSRGYGPPSLSYETDHHTSFHDHEPVIYEDPSESSFAPSPSQRWQQRLPFARSRKLDTTTSVPSVANLNGFSPIF